ncbi:MAG: VOC family protein [Pseudomonadota bacterium]
MRAATCLWFDGNGHEAAETYCDLLPNSRITGTLPGPGDVPMLVEFALDGAPFQALNGGPHYKLNEAASIVWRTGSQDETDRLWAALCQGGTPGRCGWLIDRFGMSWQIVPDAWMRLAASDDREAVGRAFGAMMEMDKLDMPRLQAAFDGTAS